MRRRGLFMLGFVLLAVGVIGAVELAGRAETVGRAGSPARRVGRQEDLRLPPPRGCAGRSLGERLRGVHVGARQPRDLRGRHADQPLLRRRLRDPDQGGARQVLPRRRQARHHEGRRPRRREAAGAPGAQGRRDAAGGADLHPLRRLVSVHEREGRHHRRDDDRRPPRTLQRRRPDGHHGTRADRARARVHRPRGDHRSWARWPRSTATATAASASRSATPRRSGSSRSSGRARPKAAPSGPPSASRRARSACPPTVSRITTLTDDPNFSMYSKNVYAVAEAHGWWKKGDPFLFNRAFGMSGRRGPTAASGAC